MLADQPDLFAPQVLRAHGADALGRAVGHAHTDGGEAGRGPDLYAAPPGELAPCDALQHGLRRTEATSGTWFYLGRPRPATGKIMATSGG